MEPKQPNDRYAQLVKRMKKGDRKAAAECYDDLAPKVYGFIFSRTNRKDAAEDLSQEIFIKLIERIESFDEKKGHFLVWFWRLARNTLIDHYREKRPAAFADFEEEEIEAVADGDSVHPAHHGDKLDMKMEHERLPEFIVTLSEEEQAVFEARYVGELSYKEMAELLGKSEGALRVDMVRLKKKIKEKFNV